MRVSVAEDLRIYAGRRWPTLNHKGRKRELQRLLMVGARRIKSLYEGEVTAVPRGVEVMRINALIEETNKNDFAALQDRISRLEAMLIPRDAKSNHGQMAGGRTPNYGRRRGDVAGAADETD